MSRNRRERSHTPPLPLGATIAGRQPLLHFVEGHSAADLLDKIHSHLASRPRCRLTIRSFSIDWIIGAKQVCFAIFASDDEGCLTAATTEVLRTASALSDDGTPHSVNLIELDGCDIDWGGTVALPNGSTIKGVTFRSARHALEFSDTERKIIAETVKNFVPPIGPPRNVLLDGIQDALLKSEAFADARSLSRESIRKTLLKAGLWDSRK